MRGATLFSGIGAPEIAAPDIDWVWHAEIEAFPSAVLAHHHGTPNLGDVTADDFIERAKQHGPIDVLVAGSPCQSFSVAGRRLGLDDPRGNLALVTLRICQQLQPRWIVFENVPGLLSSGRGDDFAAFLDEMEKCGYSGAWRILDAQHAGVAQRRRRVFVVGHFGDDWRPPAAVLFEQPGVCGDTPPSREAREETAPYSGGGIDQGRVVGAVTSKWAKGTGGPAGDEAYNLVCFPDKSPAQHEVFATSGHAEYARENPTLRRSSGDLSQGGSEGLVVSGDEMVCFPSGMSGTQNPSVGNVASTLKVATTLAFAQNTRDEVRLQGGDGQITGALAANSGSKQTTYVAAFQSSQSGVRTADTHATLDAHNGSRRQNGVTDGLTVRRLTPRECERLQGFPDDFTLIPYRHGKPAADGPRYKALGNSMAVPVIGWVLDRVRLFTELRP